MFKIKIATRHWDYHFRENCRKFYFRGEVTVDKIETLSLKSNIQNLVFAAMKNDKFNSWIEKIELQCNVVTIFDSIYPDRLREMYNPPTLLFTRGDLSLLQKEITVVVGARQPTGYSRFVLKQLIPQLIEQDFCDCKWISTWS